MNKIVFIICLVIIGATAMRNAEAMGNPWIDCGDDISCGAKKAGFNFPLQVDNYTVRAMNGMLELRFSWDGERKVIVRKARTFAGESDENGIIDISGDYNQYPVNKTVALDNGVKFAVRGENGNYKVVNFAAETGYYSITCDEGLRQKDIERFYELLTEAEAPRHDEDDVNGLAIERSKNLHHAGGSVKTASARDCFPRTLQKKGVTAKCFELANLGQDTFCSASEIKMINEYYEKRQDKGSTYDGSGNLCAK